MCGGIVALDIAFKKWQLESIEHNLQMLWKQCSNKSLSASGAFAPKVPWWCIDYAFSLC